MGGRSSSADGDKLPIEAAAVSLAHVPSQMTMVNEAGGAGARGTDSNGPSYSAGLWRSPRAPPVTKSTARDALRRACASWPQRFSKLPDAILQVDPFTLTPVFEDLVRAPEEFGAPACSGTGFC